MYVCMCMGMHMPSADPTMQGTALITLTNGSPSRVLLLNALILSLGFLTVLVRPIGLPL